MMGGQQQGGLQGQAPNAFGQPAPYQQPQQGAYNPFASAFGGGNPFHAAIMSLMQGQQQVPQYTQQSVAADQAAMNAGTGTPQSYTTPANIQTALAGAPAATPSTTPGTGTGTAAAAPAPNPQDEQGGRQ